MENRSGMMLGQCEDIPVIIDTIKDYIYTPESNDTSDKYLLLSNSTDNHLQLLNISTPEPPQYQLNDLCRLCSNSNSQMIPIFDEAATQNNLCEKIHKHLPIKITQVDTLPLQVCYQCAATLLAWHELVEGCQAAELKLLQMQAEIQKKNHKEKDITVPPIVVDPLKITQKNTNTADAQVQTIVEKSKETSEKDEEAANDLNSVRNSSSSYRVIQTHWGTTVITKQKDQSDCSRLEEDERGPRRSVVRQKPRKVRLKPANEYSCDHCDFTARQKKFLATHVVQKHPDFKADARPRESTRIDKDLVEAARMEVDGRVLYHCKDCGKNLFSPYTFSWHTRIHTGERPYTCHICGKQFRVNQGLGRHLKETHAGIKNFPCDICDRMFATKRVLDDHRRIHTGERPYVCQTCGKAFKQKASLFVHKRTHSDSFPFRCMYCDQGFRTRPQLAIHVTKHTGEKPYVCDVCSRPFRIKHELKRHKLIHSEEKPWQCAECGLFFRQKRYLVNHRRINHQPTEG